ncbi:hypothetical protein V6N13_138354 [Hibiscus sabdariffa]|uniref:AT-hook motif nuclear-localized protein n=1 Tax=Hibiscus sabdariffa TaxID=183260 RepID=A0ABR2QD77_9ROSI
MESREVQGQSAAPAGRRLQIQSQQAQPMVIGPTSSSYPSNSTLINSNPTTIIPPSSPHPFSFNPLASPPSHNQQLKPLDSLNSVAFDGSSQFQYNLEPSMKKKRGRPRKYAPDGNIALQLAPTTPMPTHSANHGATDSVDLASVGPVAEPPPKRNRGRPPGSGKRQIDALGVGFTPHVITVNAGEDIASKITAFSQQGPRAICILSANGDVCNVTLRQSGSMVKYEIIVGNFIADGKKQNLDVSRTGPFIPTSNMQNFGAPGTTVSSPTHAGSSESSDENGGSPLNGGSGFYNNSVPPSMHNNNM